MRIGILTFHRAHNYGAALQCYALQEVLRGLGHDVEIIDYRQKWTEAVYKVFSFTVLNQRYSKLIDKIKYLWRTTSRFRPFMIARKNYSSFRDKYLCISDKYRPDEELSYDVCIIGSDQVWGINCLGNKPDSVYLGNFKVKRGCIKTAYGISSNIESIDYLQQHGILNESINNFDYFSFREQAVVERVYLYTNRELEQCIDPTLLTTDCIWRPLLNNKWKARKYIVCYRARGNGDTGFSLENTAETLANNLQCEYIDLTPNQYSVEDFVSIIANAKYVVTTSFHATVFALIYRVPLASYLLHDGHDARYEDLLNRIGGSQFLYETSQSPLIGETIDWDTIYMGLSNYKKSSFSFLVKSLGQKQ